MCSWKCYFLSTLKVFLPPFLFFEKGGGVDFCTPRRKLIIELDGGQHLEQEEYDAERTKFLESKGYRVLRFWNNEVMKEIDSVMGAIELALDEEELLWLRQAGHK